MQEMASRRRSIRGPASESRAGLPRGHHTLHGKDRQPLTSEYVGPYGVNQHDKRLERLNGRYVMFYSTSRVS